MFEKPDAQGKLGAVVEDLKKVADNKYRPINVETDYESEALKYEAVDLWSDSTSGDPQPTDGVLRSSAIYCVHGVFQEDYKDDDDPYYAKALEYLETNPDIGDLYTLYDLGDTMVWAEICWLLITAYGVPKTLDWNTLSGEGSCVLVNRVNGEDVPDNRLANYRNKIRLRDYYDDIRRGYRYIPAPLLFAFEDIVHRVNLDMGKDEALKEVTYGDLKTLLLALADMEDIA